jgi:hypothetical protein
MLVILFAVILKMQGMAAIPSHDSNVTLVTINCVADSAAIPTIGVADTRYGETRDQQSTHTMLTNGMYAFRIALSPGHYFFIVQTSHCNAVLAVTVLAGVERHLVGRLSHSITHVDTACSVAGTLPFAGLHVEVVYPNGVVRSTTLDGNAYYAEYLGPQRYTLQIDGATGPPAAIAVDLSGSSKADAAICPQHLIRDVHLNDL